MTKFKQGDRVVPGVEQAYNLIKEATDTLMDLRIKAEKSSVNEAELYAVQMKLFQAMDSLSLTPAIPKWEPVTGQEYYLIGSNQVVKYIGYNEESKEYVFYHKENDLYDAWLLEYIRPIAPSPEEELRDALAAKLWGTEVRVASEMAEMLMPIILDWHNRHKEGEGR